MKGLIGKSMQYFDTLESTNKFVLSSLKERDFEEGTLIRTGFQKHGQGLGSNHWESEKDKNLLLSIVLKPSFLKPELQFYLNKFVSLAVYDFVKHTLPSETISVKWPNDVYINDKKVCGILINNTLKGDRFEYVVVGIGINVNQQEFVSDAPNPVSLIHHTNKKLSLDKCLQSLILYLNRRYEQMKSRNMRLIDADYMNVLYRYQKRSEFISKGKVFFGKIIGVSTYGQLKIETDQNEVLEFDFKEVEHKLLQEKSTD